MQNMTSGLWISDAIICSCISCVSLFTTITDTVQKQPHCPRERLHLKDHKSQQNNLESLGKVMRAMVGASYSTHITKFKTVTVKFSPFHNQRVFLVSQLSHSSCS